MALITRQNVKDYLDITGTDQDDQIKELTEYVSAAVETYCDRKFTSSSYTEYLNGSGLGKLYTKQYPITEITSMHYDTSYEWADSTLVGSGYYMVVDDMTIQFLNHTLEDYPASVKLVYTAGYATIPSDIKFVCITEVVRHLQRKDDPAVIDRSSENSSISYDTGDFLPANKTILNRYSKVRLY